MTRSKNTRKISNMTLLALALASSKRAQPAFVRAFTQSGLRTPSSSMGLASNILLQNEQNRNTNQETKSPFCLQQFRLSSSKVAATVEDDLDSALDEILGSAFKEAGDDESEAVVEQKSEEGDVAVDFTDDKFLSTSNPYWTNAGMDQRVIDVLSGKGITKFTEVQGKAFEPALAGRDLIGRSRTGTGKTIAFGLPSVHRLAKLAEQKGNVDERGRRKRGRKVGMIVLCPTRELARQVNDEISQIAKPFNLYTTVFHGGVSYDPQVCAQHS